MHTNFEYLAAARSDIAEPGQAAEELLHTQPDACVRQLGILAGRVTEAALAADSLTVPDGMTQAERIRMLKREGLLPYPVDCILHALRRARDEAAHGTGYAADTAVTLLRLSVSLCGWFASVYVDPAYLPAPFVMHADTEDAPAPAPDNPAGQETVSVVQDTPAEPEVVPIVQDMTPVSRTARMARAEAAAARISLTEAENALLLREQIRLDISLLPTVNLALRQNGIPTVRSITVVNGSPEALTDITLRLTCEPDLCLPFERHIESVASGCSLELNNITLSLNGTLLAALTERMTGLLTVSLVSGGTLLCREQTDITVLAYDEWHGSRICPELLCAFVTPNHPDIVRINARAADLLGGWTGDPSLDAYQSRDVNRVLTQAAAVYGALQEQNIVYSVPPASFEAEGQRVRLCDTVLNHKMGTCLDLTLLYASCLEAMGLHPVLVLKKGHIFAAVWLEDTAFPETVQDDASLITKRLVDGIGEMAVVECTCLCAGKPASFDDARQAAAEQLKQPDSVEYIIDVARARACGIRPLPLRAVTENGVTVIRPEAPAADITAAPVGIRMTSGENIREAGADELTPATRREYWERRLLDLGLRNTLINLRLSRSIVPILTPSADELENALSDGSDFTILPRPAEVHAAETAGFETLCGGTEASALLQADFKAHRLRSILSEGELADAVKELYRSARTAMEENGANTLYLALGLLRWYENPRSRKPRFAPLILLPVEIVRRSGARGYVIRLRDDEPQMNVTVLEKLKQDFGITVTGLDPLPQDEHGIDTRRVFTVMRKAVMGQTNWDVLECALLGIFSFSQFVMWNDLRVRSAELENNKIVRSLTEGRLAWEPDDMTMPDRVPEDGVLLPIPADASQLYAIRTAAEGKSFVLHGPPGTGKSQTITSLIANALAQGKTVLFVAEKMAALEVVQKRLDKIGIGPFCLELHSNKSKKRDVLEQLRAASEVTKTRSAEAFADTAADIAALRRELDGYARALHREQPCGLSLYEMIGRSEADRDAGELNAFDPAVIRGTDAALLRRQADAVERLTAAARETGHPHGHPLSAVGCSVYTQSLRADAKRLSLLLKDALEQLRTALRAFDADTGLTTRSREDIDRAAALARELKLWTDMPAAWAKTESIGFLCRQVQTMSGHYLKAAEERGVLSASFTDAFFALDGASLANEYRTAVAKWFLPRLVGLNSLTKKLAPYAKSPIVKDNLSAQLDMLVDCQNEARQAEALFAQYGMTLDRLYAGEETDWADVSARAAAASDSAERLDTLTGSGDFRAAFCTVRRYSDTAGSLLSAYAAAEDAVGSFNAVFAVSENGAGDDWIESLVSVCDALYTHTDDLKEWVTWNAAAAEAEACGLAPVVEAYRAGMAHEDVAPAYRRAVYTALAAEAIDRDEVLNRFSGGLFNDRIARFRKLDGELARLTQEEIYCRLASRVPNFTREAAQSSELGILQRAIKSGGRGMSIRRLFDDIPNMLPRLCPCMLMSPISAAQYLSPDRAPFDMVVFDEASQVPTCKAVGALARGREAVIVGDPRQMPPTSFFSANTVDEDSPDTEDLESILDDCLAIGMPATHLLWHYRSRHESLIAYSNSRFYENKLFTFPSVNDRETRVHYVHVDGTFDRGRTRQNRAEAEAVLAELQRRCHDPETAGYSVGVVTFNASQQELIEDLLTDACKTDPVLEAWAYNAEEPLFIKNLENVQGDERDVILFSVGYGPDKTGRVSVNFGPLNREGGWRRLNVAISRARCEMTVFAALTPDRIDLSRTSSEGVAALRGFLAYAAGEPLSLQEDNARVEASADGIADRVCELLHREGFETDRSIGHSGFRVDVGVIDPDNPGHYLLGILLDGPSYGHAGTVRDRDIAQVSVLNGLGWQILRLWSMDWWDNSRKESARILRVLRGILAQREASRNGTQNPDGGNPPVPETPDTPVADGSDTTAPYASDTPEPTAPDTENRENAGTQKPLAAKPAPTTSAPRRAKPRTTAYQPAALKEEPLSPDVLLTPSLTARLRRKLVQVIEAEAPVSETVLFRRVVRSFCIDRVTPRLQARLRQVLETVPVGKTEQNGIVFYWSGKQNPAAYFGIRVSGEGDCARDASDVPPREVANALCCVLYDQVSMAEGDLIREVAKMLGYTRLGTHVTAAAASGIAFAVGAGFVTDGQNGTLILTDEGNRVACVISGDIG